MISVADAQAHVLALVAAPTPPEIVPLTAALGRVLAEDLRAPIDVPPTDIPRSTAMRWRTRPFRPGSGALRRGR